MRFVFCGCESVRVKVLEFFSLMLLVMLIGMLMFVLFGVKMIGVEFKCW